jgi:hypothetical protein
LKGIELFERIVVVFGWNDFFDNTVRRIFSIDDYFFQRIGFRKK